MIRPPLNIIRSNTTGSNLPLEPQNVDRGGEPPDDGSMENRLRNVEQSISRIDALLPNLASKADISSAEGGIIKWMVATAIVLSVGATTIMTFVLNNAVPKRDSGPAVIVAVPQAAGAITTRNEIDAAIRDAIKNYMAEQPALQKRIDPKG